MPISSMGDIGTILLGLGDEIVRWTWFRWDRALLAVSRGMTGISSMAGSSALVSAFFRFRFVQLEDWHARQ